MFPQFSAAIVRRKANDGAVYAIWAWFEYDTALSGVVKLVLRTCLFTLAAVLWVIYRSPYRLPVIRVWRPLSSTWLSSRRRRNDNKIISRHHKHIVQAQARAGHYGRGHSSETVKHRSVCNEWSPVRHCNLAQRTTHTHRSTLHFLPGLVADWLYNKSVLNL